MKKRICTRIGLVVVVATLLIGAASFLSTRALSGSPANFDAPPQAGGACALDLSSGSFGSGRVRGQVLTAQGLASAGLRVQLLLPDGRLARETRTDGRGSYQFSDLPSGRHQLRVVDDDGRPLALQKQVSPDVWPEQGRAPVERTLILAAPVPNPGANPESLPSAPARVEQPARLQANGAITGVVTAADTGFPPHETVRVRIYDETGALQTSAFADYTTGAYSITVPSGTYKVKFEPVFSDYALEWFNDQRDFSSATPVMVSDDTVTSNINAALDVGGKITGQVTAAAGGAPIQSVYVQAYTSPTSTSQVAYDNTDASGVYTVTGLLTDTHYLKFDPPSSSGYVEEYYDNQRTLATADAIPVALDSVVYNINAALDVGGKITGPVTAAVGGAPVQDVTVRAYSSPTSTTQVAYDNTDASGVYTITSLLTDTYYLKFDPPYGSDYLEEYYDNQWTLATADPIPVALNSVVSNINAALIIGGKITGQVTAATGGAPIDNVTVRAYSSPTSTNQVAYDSTDASGVYTITDLLTGTYYLKFDPPYGSDYLEEYYDNQWTLATADPIPVAIDSVVSDINAALIIGGKITGQVTAATGGAPIDNVTVRAYASPTSTTHVAYDYTDASGVYTITDLLTGTYYLKFDPPYGSDYLEEYYDNQWTLATADPIPVAIDSVVSDINAALIIGGKITGQVTAAAGGAPIDNVYVRVYTSTTSTSYAAYDSTDASGVYTITDLLTDTYYLKFDPPYGSDFLEEYHDNQRSLATADPIPVALNSVVSNINAALDTGGKISGQVTAAGGAPIQNVRVYAYSSTTTADWDYVASGSTTASGIYTITNLAQGTYYLKFDPSGLNYLTEYYNDKPTLASADAISVTLNSVVPNINAVLRNASKITGRVTAVGSGVPLEDVDVTVYEYGCDRYQSVGSATTDPSGVYTVTGLLAGTYQVRFEPYTYGASATYIGEYYDGRAGLSTADPVSVADGSVTTGIDAELTRGGQIVGRVTAADGGTPLDDIWVDAYDSDGDFAGYGRTDATGVYTITGLAAGSYRVGFDPFKSGPSAAYVSEYYDNKSTLASADAVSVTSGGVTAGIDAVLERGGRITGQIAAADGGAPLQYVSVSVYDGDGSWAGSASTNASGVYTTSGLATGSYTIHFRTQSASGVTQDYLDEYYNDKTTQDAADAVSVTAPDLTTSIDAVLARGGKISGRVTAADTGEPLSGILVSAYGDDVRTGYTDAFGDYMIAGLPSGDYRVWFGGVCFYYYTEPRITIQYEGEYYSDKPDPGTANTVVVTAPDTTSGIDAALGGGSRDHQIYLPVVLR